MLLVVGAFGVDLDAGWVFIILALALMAHAAWVVVRERRECFVITNMRVFRLHGVLVYHLATMPLSRILDISVTKPLPGRILGFGHFVFESAAQEQGLKEIRYVAPRRRARPHHPAGRPALGTPRPATGVGRR